jgi:hypothetical protein
MEKILSSEEVLAPAREACHAAMKRLAAIEGVTVHASVAITVEVATHVFVVGSEDAQATREKIYQAEMELIDAHPGVLFDFKAG